MKKDDLLCLLDVATNTEENFEMDSMDEKEPMNQAHRVIYESLYGKFEELIENKDRFHDESASLYKEALEKYEK